MVSTYSTVPSIVFARIQKVQKVEETLNEFKRIHLVNRKMGRCMEWEGRQVGGQVDWDCAQCCVCKSPDGSESRQSTK